MAPFERKVMSVELARNHLSVRNPPRLSAIVVEQLVDSDSEVSQGSPVHVRESPGVPGCQVVCKFMEYLDADAMPQKLPWSIKYQAT